LSRTATGANRSQGEEQKNRTGGGTSSLGSEAKGQER